MEFNAEKTCCNHCPKCGASDDDIEWGTFEFEEEPFQEGICKKCGCVFHEIYKYAVTAYTEDAEPRKETTTMKFKKTTVWLWEADDTALNEKQPDRVAAPEFDLLERYLYDKYHTDLSFTFNDVTIVEDNRVDGEDKQIGIIRQIGVIEDVVIVE